MPTENRKTYTPKSKTPEQALASLMRQCARAERCSGDALRLMRRWGVADVEARKILERLIRERFIDDSRYAAAFVREKSRLGGWGSRKIAAALRAKSVAPDVIDQALRQLSPEDDSARLEELLRKKAARTTARDAYDLKVKLIRFGASRGFSLEKVIDLASQITNAEED